MVGAGVVVNWGVICEDGRVVRKRRRERVRKSEKERERVAV